MHDEGQPTAEYGPTTAKHNTTTTKRKLQNFEKTTQPINFVTHDMV